MSSGIITADSVDITADSDVISADGGLAGVSLSGVDTELIEQHLDLIATEYRESPKLLALARFFLTQLDEVRRVTASIPSYFDLDTAVGHQLTLIGKWLGWPRCHCVCDISPVFGFDCGTESPLFKVVGFCVPDSTWIDCHEIGSSEICLYDDEVYRGYLKARRYQMTGLYDIASLEAAVRHVWGPTAWVPAAGDGRVVLSPGRALLPDEVRQLPLAVRVQPVAPGIRIRLHLPVGRIFGFGEGWGGFCDDPPATWLCETDPYAYDCVV